jgi:hypothetical protein
MSEINYSDDISGLENINELYESSLIKNWIKRIPLNKTIPFEFYDKKEYFTHVADVVLDNEVHLRGKNEEKKKRNTLIALSNYFDEINLKIEWIYIFVINGRIVKIGGTRDGIKNRFGSYLCGHHIQERGKSGKASETNKYIYNTLLFYLECGCKINIYGYKLPVEEITRNVFGRETKIRVQTYHGYESVLIEDFRKQTGFIPYLCDNSDPEYKKTKGTKLAKPVSELNVNFEARLLQDRFNALCVAGDIDAVKEMWKQDQTDIAKNVNNNLVIDKNTVLLTNDKKLRKWLENNRVDKKYEFKIILSK